MRARTKNHKAVRVVNVPDNKHGWRILDSNSLKQLYSLGRTVVDDFVDIGGFELFIQSQLMNDGTFLHHLLGAAVNKLSHCQHETDGTSITIFIQL